MIADLRITASAADSAPTVVTRRYEVSGRFRQLSDDRVNGGG